MCLHGDINSKRKTIAALERLLTRKESIARAKQPSKEHVGTKIANNVFKSLGVGLGLDSVLAICN